MVHEGKCRSSIRPPLLGSVSTSEGGIMRGFPNGDIGGALFNKKDFS